MKIGGINDGTLYWSRGLDIGVWDDISGFRSRGRIPTPATGIERFSFTILNQHVSKRLLGPVLGSYTTTNIWPLTDEHLLATVSRWLFASRDGGNSWEMVHKLPASSGMMGVLPTSVHEHDGTVYLAEYPLGNEQARILTSTDYGVTWTVAIERTDIRHFHGLFTDPYTDQLWATTGDTDDESMVGIFTDSGFEPVGSGSQRWRAVQLAFTSEAILWGEDCPYTETAEILRLPRNRLDADEPEPDVVGTTDSPVYYAETLSVGDETWVILTTTAEPEHDSTAPLVNQSIDENTARVLAASSKSEYETWYELYETKRRTTLGQYIDSIPLSNSYLFLATDPELGVVINPYNTARSNGRVLRIPPTAFENHEFPVHTKRQQPSTVHSNQ